MATFTPNLNLKNPALGEQYNINDFNDNNNKIDTFAGNIPPTFDGPIQGIPAITLGGGVGYQKLDASNQIRTSFVANYGCVFNGVVFLPATSTTSFARSTLSDLFTRTITPFPATSPNNVLIKAISVGGKCFAFFQNQWTAQNTPITLGAFSTTNGISWTALATHNTPNFFGSGGNPIVNFAGISEDRYIHIFIQDGPSSTSVLVRRYDTVNNVWSTQTNLNASSFSGNRITFLVGGIGNGTHLYFYSGSGSGSGHSLRALTLNSASISTNVHTVVLGTRIPYELKNSSFEYLGNGKAVMQLSVGQYDEPSQGYAFILDVNTLTLKAIPSFGWHFTGSLLGGGDGYALTSSMIWRLI